MPIANPSFEVVGAAPGLAASWTATTVSSAVEIAEFGAGALDGAEHFNAGWDNDVYLFAFESGDLESAVFDEALNPEAIEDFAHGWLGNESYLWELASTATASFDTTIPEAFEDFEDEWFGGVAYLGLTRTYTVDALTDVFTCADHGFVSGDVVRMASTGDAPAPLVVDVAYYVRDVAGDTFKLATTPGGIAIDLTDDGSGVQTVRAEFAAADVEAAAFDAAPEAMEDFEEGWLGNESYVFEFAPGALSAASFGAGAGSANFEAFESVCGPKIYSATPATDVLASIAHALGPVGSTDWKVTVHADGGQPPAPLYPAVTYYLRDVAADTFKLAAQVGGPAIDITDLGLGTQYATADPARYWTTVMSTI